MKTRLDLFLGVGILIILTLSSFYQFKNSSNLSCQNLDPSQKFECWEKALDQSIASKGLNSGFALLEKFYREDPQFASNCHNLSHRLGQKAYQIYLSGQRFSTPSSASYCGYGFYHGFTEAMVNHEGSAKRAGQFCASLKPASGQPNRAVTTACFHGIGHGIADDLMNLGLDEKSVLNPSLKLCREVAVDDLSLDNCASGIFNLVAIAYNSQRWSLGDKNPYWICSEQTEYSIKKPCFEEMNTLVLKLGNFDLLNSIKLIPPDKDLTYSKLAIQGIAGYQAYFQKGVADNSKIARQCYQLDSNLVQSCITGFAAGLVEHSPPGAESVAAVNFCNLEINTESDRSACFERILNYLSLIYPTDKFNTVCSSIPKKYQPLCLGFS